MVRPHQRVRLLTVTLHILAVCHLVEAEVISQPGTEEKRHVIQGDDKVRYFEHSKQMQTAARGGEASPWLQGLKDLVKLNPNQTCEICKVVTWLVQQTFLLNEDRVHILVNHICKVWHIEDDDICDGITKVFKDEVLTVVDRLILRPDEVCGASLGPSCAHVYDPYQMWNVTLPPKAETPGGHGKNPENPPKSKTQTESTVRVLQLSDIHVDQRYVVGSNADCDRPQCCRNTSGTVKSPAGRWGSYSYCDTPPWTVEYLFKYLSKTDKFDYILWTGDLPSHADWNQTRENQIYLLHYLSGLFLKYFPDTPVYPSLGNHESLPVDGFPPPYITGVDSISWLYNEVVKSWSPWLPESTKYNISRGGFYTTVVKPGFRIVSLNMNYCNTKNWWMLLNTTDPVGELQWLIDVLYQSEISGEKVHIIGHIAPGLGDCMKAWSWNYYKIVNRFVSVIAGQFFGHTHTDFIELFYDLETLRLPLAVAYIAPSVTTFYNLNPGYRVYTIDGMYRGSPWTVLDHETFILNLTEANSQREPLWIKEYTAREAYNMPDLTPGEWHKFTQRLLVDNSTLYMFHRHYFKGRPHTPSCGRKCAEQYVCSMRSGRSHDPSLCPHLSGTWADHQSWLDSVTFC